MIKYDFLPQDSYFLIAPIFAQEGVPVPDVNKSKIYVAFDEDQGRIVGFYCLQVKLHAEPMWISPEYRGSPMWINLISGIEPYTREDDTYIVAENPIVDGMCRELMQEGVLMLVPYNVYVKKVVATAKVTSIAESNYTLQPIANI